MMVGRFAIVSLVLLTAASPSAVFHTHLKKSDPAANDTLMSPAAVKLWFSEKVEIPFTRVTVKNIAGVAQPMGALAFSDTSEDAPVVAAITGKLPPGSYTVTWSAAAKDGHPAKGKFEFVVNAAP